MSYLKKAGRGIGIIFIMNILAYSIAYFTRLILARKLGPADYGLFYAVFTFVIFFLFFRDLGLNQATTKYITEFRVQKNYNRIKSAIFAVLGSQIASSLFFGLIFFFTADFLAAHYFKADAASTLLKLMVAYTLFSISFTFLKSFFSGFQRFVAYSLIDFFKNGIILLLVVIFFSWGMTLLSPVLAYVIVGPILIIIFLPKLLRTYNPLSYRMKSVRETSKLLFIFGLPVIMTDVGDKVISYIDTLMLTSMRSLTEVGIYNVVLPSAMMLLFISTTLSSVFFPIFAELWAKKDFKRLKEGVKMFYKYIFVAITPMVLAIAVFSETFIYIFFGSDYVSGANALRILLFGVLLFIVAGVNHAMISAAGKPKTVTKIIFGAAAINAGLNLIMIPVLGINGAAVATTASYAFAFIISTIILVKTIESKVPIAAWIKTVVISVVFVAVAYFTVKLLNYGIYLETALALVTASLVYLALALLLKVIDIAEIKKYIKIVASK